MSWIPQKKNRILQAHLAPHPPPSPFTKKKNEICGMYFVSWLRYFKLNIEELISNWVYGKFE